VLELVQLGLADEHGHEPLDEGGRILRVGGRLVMSRTNAARSSAMKVGTPKTS